MSQSPGEFPQLPEPIGAHRAGPRHAKPEPPEQQPPVGYAPSPYIPPQSLQPPVTQATIRPPAQPLRPKRRRPPAKPIALGGLLGVVILAIMVAVQLMRPLPSPDVDLTLAASHTFTGQAPTLPWPAGAGQASVDVAGLGTMGSTGSETPTPTASVAKVMTAYVFLKDHPLKAGENGQTFTVGADEAARYKVRSARGESLVPVTAGEPFTERLALEALLVISANNIAHEIARWDAGGDQAYVAKMNATARQLGMTHTTYTDPSGYESSTVSTATDQVKLLRAAIMLPAFVDAASQPSFDTPYDKIGPRPSTNGLLGQDGVFAGKTGYTGAAGGNFVFAARKTVNGTTVTIVGAVMNQSGVPSSEPTVAAAKPLIEAAESALTSAALAGTGAAVGDVDDRLGGRTPLVASAPVTVVGWPGLTVKLALVGEPHIPHQAPAGRQLGSISLGAGPDAPKLPVTLGIDLDPPTIPHRISRLS